MRDLVLVKGVLYQIVLDFVPGLFSIVHRSSGGIDSLSPQNGFHLRSPKKAILFNAYSTSCICSFLQFMMLKIFVRMDGWPSSAKPILFLHSLPQRIWPQRPLFERKVIWNTTRTLIRKDIWKKVLLKNNLKD